MQQVMIMKYRFILVSLLLWLFFGGSGWSDQKPTAQVKSITISSPDDTSLVVRNIVTIFAQRIEERSGAKVSPEGNLKIELLIKPGIGEEGFAIASGNDGSIQIIGNDERGVLYGVGKFLRTSGYNKRGFKPGKWRGTSVPEKSVRGIYLATHFYNYYQTAPVAEVERYLEDLAFWGVNSIMVWYDMHHFDGFDDPEAVAYRDRLTRFLQTARNLDLKVGFIMVGNEGYVNSPTCLQTVPGGSRGGFNPTDVCPNKPAGMEYILKNKNDFFEWCRDVKPEFICIWPYDQGGCGCFACQPWGSNGFLKCAENISKMAKEKLPGVKIMLSTWFFDSNEWQGLSKLIATDTGMVDMIMAEDIPGYENSKFPPLTGKLPTVGFPEISMYNTFPWGGFGATPLPCHLAGQWEKVRDVRLGGFPYSEGIFDDINKVTYTQLYWDSAIAPEEILKEYIAWEFSPEVVDDVLKVFTTLEKNHHMRWWLGELEGVKLALDWFPSKGAKPQADPGAEEAYALVKQVDSKLPEWAQKSWRWRLVFIRAMLDAELKANGGSPNETCIEGFKELLKIYHTSVKTDPAVKPPISVAE